VPNKRRRRPAPKPSPDSTPSAGPPRPTTRQTKDRRERKEEARRAREEARKRARRRALTRRVATVTVVAVAGLLVFTFLFRAASPKPFSAAASAAADAAGCSGVQTPLASAPGGQHLTSGEPHVYDTEPATSGPHDPSPLPDDPHVYTEMPPETRLVHNLEHGFVNVYYRPDGDGALPTEVLDALTTFANAHARTILSPHTSLPDGVSLAFTAWNKLLTCPSGITADQAQTVAQGWWDSFACSTNAPEPPQRGTC
jgi:hypothetical protein